MRIVFSFLLLATFLLRPVMELTPFVYYQLNIDYIIENYCVNREKPKLQCNGKCYLMRQLEAQKAPQDALGTITSIPDTFVPLYFQDIAMEVPVRRSEHKKATHFIQHNFQYNFLFIQDISEPPEFV